MRVSPETLVIQDNDDNTNLLHPIFLRRYFLSLCPPECLSVFHRLFVKLADKRPKTIQADHLTYSNASLIIRCHVNFKPFWEWQQYKHNLNTLPMPQMSIPTTIQKKPGNYYTQNSITALNLARVMLMHKISLSNTLNKEKATPQETEWPSVLSHVSDLDCQHPYALGTTACSLLTAQKSHSKGHVR